MELFEVIKQRFSARAYQDKPVDEKAVQAILNAANDAPSAGNKQAYEIVLVRDSGRRRQLAEAAFGQQFIAQAPVVLVFVANPERNRKRYGQRGAELYTVQDATIACAYAQMAATALGLGTCWVGAFDDHAVAKAVGVPPPLRPVAVLPIGYPAEQPKPRQRRALGDLVHLEQLRGVDR